MKRREKKGFSLALNQMPCRSAMQRVDIKRDSLTGREIVVSSTDLSDTVQGGFQSNEGMKVVDVFVLALGPRYQAEDFDIQSIFPLEPFSSGVQSKRLFSLQNYLFRSCFSSQL